MDDPFYVEVRHAYALESASLHNPDTPIVDVDGAED